MTWGILKTCSQNSEKKLVCFNQKKNVSPEYKAKLIWRWDSYLPKKMLSSIFRFFFIVIEDKKGKIVNKKCYCYVRLEIMILD